MDRDKFIDESWKDRAKEVNDKSNNSPKEPSPAKDEVPANFDLNFVSYITSLGYQAMIFLGVIPNPITNEIQKNINQAKLIIDTLVMLRDKTVNNLTKEEDDLLNSSIYELQISFIEVSQNETKQN